jgi:hypothetical protein
MAIDDRARCPLCSRRIALVLGRLARHKQHDDWCEGSHISTYEATLVLARRLVERQVGCHG